jgi:hypothetical protein
LWCLVLGASHVRTGLWCGVVRCFCGAHGPCKRRMGLSRGAASSPPAWSKGCSSTSSLRDDSTKPLAKCPHRSVCKRHLHPLPLNPQQGSFGRATCTRTLDRGLCLLVLVPIHLVPLVSHLQVAAAEHLGLVPLPSTRPAPQRRVSHARGRLAHLLCDHPGP